MQASRWTFIAAFLIHAGAESTDSRGHATAPEAGIGRGFSAGARSFDARASRAPSLATEGLARGLG